MDLLFLFFFFFFLVIHRDKPEKQEKIEKKEPIKGMYLAFDTSVCLFYQWIKTVWSIDSQTRLENPVMDGGDFMKTSQKGNEDFKSTLDPSFCRKTKIIFIN